MELIVKRGDHAKVAAATADGPEELRVVGLAGRQQPAIGGDDIDREKIIAAQSILAA
jgi:hypothetical protein